MVARLLTTDIKVAIVCAAAEAVASSGQFFIQFRASHQFDYHCQSGRAYAQRAVPGAPIKKPGTSRVFCCRAEYGIYLHCD
jgi:hypothetical protein